MKRVRRCDGCGYCNKLIKTECQECGKRIDNIPTILVEDDVNKLTDEEWKALVGESETEPENAKENPSQTPEAVGSGAPATEEKRFVCKICGEFNVVSSNDEMIECTMCHRHFMREQIEWLPEQPAARCAAAQEVAATADMPKTLAFVSVLRGKKFTLSFTANRQVFGRGDSDEDFIFNNKFISREHVVYFYQNGQAYVVDMSVNGTYINGERLVRGKEYALRAGDLLKLSNEEFVVENVD